MPRGRRKQRKTSASRSACVASTGDESDSEIHTDQSEIIEGQHSPVVVSENEIRENDKSDNSQGREKQQNQDSSSEDEEIVFNLDAARAQVAQHRRASKTRKKKGSSTSTDTLDNVQIMTQMMAKCQKELLQNQREMMQASNKNTAEVLSSLKALITEIKNSTQSTSQKNDTNNISDTHQTLRSPMLNNEHGTQIISDGRHYGSTIASSAILAEVPKSQCKPQEFSSKQTHRPKYTSNDHEFPEETHTQSQNDDTDIQFVAIPLPNHETTPQHDTYHSTGTDFNTLHVEPPVDAILADTNSNMHSISEQMKDHSPHLNTHASRDRHYGIELTNAHTDADARAITVQPINTHRQSLNTNESIGRHYRAQVTKDTNRARQRVATFTDGIISYTDNDTPKYNSFLSTRAHDSSTVGPYGVEYTATPITNHESNVIGTEQQEQNVNMHNSTRTMRNVAIDRTESVCADTCNDRVTGNDPNAKNKNTTLGKRISRQHETTHARKQFASLENNQSMPAVSNTEQPPPYIQQSNRVRLAGSREQMQNRVTAANTLHMIDPTCTDMHSHSYKIKQQSRMRIGSKTTRYIPYTSGNVSAAKSASQEMHDDLYDQTKHHPLYSSNQTSGGRHSSEHVSDLEKPRVVDAVQGLSDKERYQVNRKPPADGFNQNNERPLQIYDGEEAYDISETPPCASIITRSIPTKKQDSEVNERRSYPHDCQGLEGNEDPTGSSGIDDVPPLWPPDDRYPRVRGPSINPFIHGEGKRKTRDTDGWPMDLQQTNTRSEFQGNENQYLGVPIATRVTPRVPLATQEKPVKLPAFTGKNSWKVWYNRFNTIAQLNNWDETTRLNQLLPRLQGDAGEFVYGELPQEITCNFKKLIEELESRFRLVETHKTYEAQFSKRNQLHGETVEEYAAALKRLYDKAHVKRNPESRREGLLRRFLNGLADDQARFEVEYHKDPVNIDEAVSHVVSYMEAKKTPSMYEMADGDRLRKPKVKFNDYDSSDSEESDTDFRDELRLRFKKRKRTVRKIVKTDKRPENETKKDNSNGDLGVYEASASTITPNLQTQIEKLIETKLNGAQKKKVADEHRTPSRSRNQTGRDRVQCFFCRNYGHYQRECPEIVREQAPIPQRNHEWRRGVQPPRHSEEAEKNQATGKANISLN